MAWTMNFGDMFGPRANEDEEELLGELPPPPPPPPENPDQPTDTGSEAETSGPPSWWEPDPGRYGGAGVTPGESTPPRETPDPWDIPPPASPGETSAGTAPDYAPGDPWTYEQTWMDPYIEQNLMQRGDVRLGASQAQAAAPVLSTIEDYQRQLEARGVQTENIELLQAIARGEPSAAIEQQRERGMQAAMATAATMRGAPTSAVQRAMNQQMAEVNRNAMEAAAQQQLQAQQLVGEAAAQMRAQDMSLVDVQGQYQQ